LISINLKTFPPSAEEDAMAEQISAAEAARRLGVKPATLYAYVSRGVLSRRKDPARRTSRFDAGEIEDLARRGRPRRPANAADIVVESALTEIDGAQFRYRGLDVMGLATRRSFEEVAEFLWTGEFPAPASQPSRTTPSQRSDTAPGSSSHAAPSQPGRTTPSPSGRTTPANHFRPSSHSSPWQARPEALAVGRAAQAALPAEALPLERLQVIVPAMAATDPLRLQLDPPAVRAAARGLIAGLVDCLPSPAGAVPAGAALAEAGLADTRAGNDPPAPAAPIAERLWSRLSGHRPTPGLLAALRAALVLLADHELAASTLAARVAASVRADPYAVVATGLGAVGGALHGGASLSVESLLTAAGSPAGVPAVIRDRLRRGERVPGFGHFVYRTGDPRAALLLDLVRRAAPRSRRLAVADAVQAEMNDRGLPGPNIDFALAVLARVAGMTDGAGEAIFAVARTAGWTAHAMEEYARATPLRPRAVYVGPPPRDAGPQGS
jgi:citrate synthase